MKFVIACQKIEVTGVLPTCEVVKGMTLWPKIKWVVALMHMMGNDGTLLLCDARDRTIFL